MSAMIRRAVFLDRDDTLIYNIPYNGDPSLVKLLPGVKESLHRLKEAGFLLFIVSNQSGVGRRLITHEQVLQVNAEMERQLGKAFFTDVYNCYAAPGDPDDNTRKPSPAFLFQARDQYQLDLEKSFMVGDRLSDVQCGLNAGCRSVFLLTSEHDSEEARRLAHYVASTVSQATDWILQKKN